MIQTTQNMSEQKKLALFQKHYNLIFMIYTFGNCILRSQIKQLYMQLYPDTTSEFDIEFMIADLIKNKLLLSKRITRQSPTEILYLNKFCTGQLENRNSQNASFPSFSNQMIYESIFKMEYIITVTLPSMKKQNLELTPANVITYLNFTCNTLFASGNQFTLPDTYSLLYSVYSDEMVFSEDFLIDWKVSIADQGLWIKNNASLPDPEKILYLDIKEQRDTIRDTYKTETEKLKQFFSLSNQIRSRFNIEKIENNTVYLYYFDSMDTLKAEKLYRYKLVYMLLMYHRYLNNNMKLHITVYLHSEDRKQQLLKEEQRPVYDGLTSNYKDNNRIHSYYQNVGLLPSYWNDITVDYQVMDICSKYNITTN